MSVRKVFLVYLAVFEFEFGTCVSQKTTTDCGSGSGWSLLEWQSVVADPVFVIVRGSQPHYSLFWLVPNNEKWGWPPPTVSMHSSRMHTGQWLTICLLGGGGRFIHPEGVASIMEGVSILGVHPSVECIPSGCTPPHGQTNASENIIFIELHLLAVTIKNSVNHCQSPFWHWSTRIQQWSATTGMAIGGGFRWNTGPKLKLKNRPLRKLKQ